MAQSDVQSALNSIRSAILMLADAIEQKVIEINRLKQDVEALESALGVIQAKAAANGEDVSYLLASNALEKRK